MDFIVKYFSESNLNIPFSNEAMTEFVKAVYVMLKGMTGIFVFMLVFYLLVKVLGRVFQHSPTE